MGILTLEKEKIIFQRRDELTVVFAAAPQKTASYPTRTGRLLHLLKNRRALSPGIAIAQNLRTE